MQDLRKVVGQDRVILDDITLAFLPGAKIGVIGGNGAGKSSLLKIMAGVDSEFVGVPCDEALGIGSLRCSLPASGRFRFRRGRYRNGG